MISICRQKERGAGLMGFELGRERHAEFLPQDECFIESACVAMVRFATARKVRGVNVQVDNEEFFLALTKGNVYGRRSTAFSQASDFVKKNGLVVELKRNSELYGRVERGLMRFPSFVLKTDVECLEWRCENSSGTVIAHGIVQKFSTANRRRIAAVALALRNLVELYDFFEFTCNNKFLVDSIVNGDMRRWAQRDWVNAAGSTIANSDYLQEIHATNQKYCIIWSNHTKRGSQTSRITLGKLLEDETVTKRNNDDVVVPDELIKGDFL